MFSIHKHIKNLFCLAAVILCLSCVSNDPNELTNTADRSGNASAPMVNSEPHALGNIEYHTALLAQELFSQVRTDREYRYAVINFVPVTSLKFDPSQQGPLMLLGHQLSEGMVTEASRIGLITQDYKTTNDIVISKDADYVFSRDVSRLNAMQDIDFYIAGTITEQQQGAIVNARIIHVDSKDVVASATKFFPANIFWEREKVSTRNGLIYRTDS